MSEPFHSRYPGTSPFDDSPDDVTRFFGRNEEAEDLYLRVLSVPLLVQFGMSGLGKTSLLQAGLFPRLRRKPFLPVMVRLNTPEDSLIESGVRSVRKSCEIEGLNFTPGATTGLWEFLSTTTIFRDDLLLTPILVFDQFEEVFTLRDAPFRASLAAELGAIAAGIPPARIQDAKPRRLNVKIVISLREDYVGSLEEFSAAIPGLFHERLRLEPFSERAARDAVTRPALLEGAFESPRFELDGDALDALIHYLRGRSGIIEPIQLQLLCRHAESIARRKAQSGRNLVRLTLEDFREGHSFASVLENFYRDTLRKISPRSQSRHAARLCELGLLGSEGHRLMLEERQIQRDFHVRPETLHVLTQEKLIRREQRLESVFYEISHDRLAESVFNARQVRLPKSVQYALAFAAIAAVLVVGLLAFFNFRISRERNSAEDLIGFLIGEQFLGEVRDMGSSTLLEQVQEHLDHTAGSKDRPSLLRGLALRGRGDVKRLEGDVAAARSLYQQALDTFDGDDADTLREIARAHERLGVAFDQERKLDASLVHAAEADYVWRRVVAGVSDPVQRLEDCVSRADSILTTGFLRERLGQGDRALADAETAVDIVSNVLFGPERAAQPCRPVPGKAEPYPDAEAVRVLSRASLLRAIVLSTPEDYEGAATLAREARSLMPSSTSARQWALEALSWRAYGRSDDDPQRALDDYRQVQREAEELRHWDSGNRVWQRERAISLQMVGRGIALCHQHGGCAPMPDLDDALAVILEAIATLHALAQLDPNNISLRADVFWAQLELADALALRPDSAEQRLELLEHAGKIHAKLQGDPESRTMLGYLRDRQAQTLDALGRSEDATRARNESIAVWERLTREHPKHPLYRHELARLTPNAPAVQAAGWELGKGVMETMPFFDQLFDGDSKTAASAARKYIRARPAVVIGYRGMAIASGDRTKETRDSAEQALFLNAAVQSAQIAAWLSPSQQLDNRALLIARDHFATFLYDQQRIPDALAMVTENVVVAESLMRQSPEDSFYQAILGQAKCASGSLRRELKQAGWEEAVRSGILHIRKAAVLDRHAHWDALGKWQKYLGAELIRDGRRKEGIAQYRLALASYQLESLIQPPSEETRKAIQELTELTKAP